MTKNVFRFCAVAALALSLASFSPASMAQESSKSDGRSNAYQQMNLFGDVFKRIRSTYVEEADATEMIEAAINGMLMSLDPHSSYMNAKAYTDFQINIKGKFGGLGIQVTMEDGWVKVISPIDDTPAFVAGIEAGDFITHLDGEQVMGMSLNEAVDLMRGDPGTDITVTVARKGEKAPFDVVITRDIITVQSVRQRREGDTAYIRISSFTDQTEPGLKKAIAELSEEIGESMNGVVLDLRSNPGGSLEQAVAVADAFLERGEIVQTRGRDPRDIDRRHAKAGDLINGLPIIVLINGGSASASEIVAGALQDYHRALIVGTKSFGKGSVQTVIGLGEGRGAMRLTTARYYTPSGRSIQAEGIEPDLHVEPAKIEKFTTVGKRRTEASLRGHLENPEAEDDATGEATGTEGTDDGTQDAVDKAREEAKEKDEEESSTDKAIADYQLAYALDLIRGLAIMQGSKGPDLQ